MPDDEQTTPTVPNNDQGDTPSTDSSPPAAQVPMPDGTSDSNGSTSDAMNQTTESGNPQETSADLSAGQSTSTPDQHAEMGSTGSSSPDSEDLMSGAPAPTTPETPEEPK